MPKSRSKRSSYKPPAQRKPKPSPKWLPYLGVGLIVLGIVLVILSYLVALPGGNFNLLFGFALMAGGLVALSRYR